MARILIAEDRLAERERVRHILERAGHSVALARNGVEAIDRYSELRPEVVIMDLFMPVMNGFDAMVHLIRMFPSARVIATADATGAVGLQALHVALELGAAAAVEKPLQESPLLGAIETTLAA